MEKRTCTRALHKRPSIKRAPSRRPDTLPANTFIESSSQPAISHYQNNTTSETRHHVDPDLSALYTQHSTEYQVPLFDHSHAFDQSQRAPSAHHAIAQQPPRLRTSTQYGLNIPTQLPPTPRTTSRHTPRSPDKHTFAVPRVPPPKSSPPNNISSGNPTDLLDSYLKMLNTTPNNSADAVAPVSPAMNQDLSKLLDMFQAVGNSANPSNPTPHSTPYMDANDYRSLEELITSPEFTSPLFEDTPNLSDASPFTPSSSSTRHQTSPALFDYSDTSSGGIPLFGPSPIVLDSNQSAAYGTPNLDNLHLRSAHLGFEILDSLLPVSGSPTSPAADTRDLFSPTTSPLFSDSPSVSRPEGVRSVSDPVKRTHPTGHRKNLTPEQLLDVNAPTQQRNYYGPSATSRKVIPAGFEERRAKIVAKRRRGLGADGEELSEDAILNAAVEDKRRANTVAARRSRQRKLEYVKTLETQLEEKSRELELWKERAIAAEKMVRRLEGKE
ncbi:hypothetical protein OPQ81_011767 [Rhizoctonia solani]|nr:hypothetical protein OPQ81_011767 [Rhizoctonia solani]